MLSSVAQQAKDLRQQLKAVFPLCKFRVRSSNYSMGSSIRVSWIDGPTVAEVDAISSRYESIRRDEGSGEILSGGNRYVHCERRFVGIGEWSQYLRWSVGHRSFPHLIFLMRLILKVLVGA
jgi:hypothetical protein